MKYNITEVIGVRNSNNKDAPLDKFNFISKYLAETSYIRKIGDLLLAGIMVVIIGFAMGKLVLPISKPHTVTASFNISREIQKTLDVYQNKSGAYFVGRFQFHNGSQSVGGFNFMKYSLTEYSSRLGIDVPAEDMQSTPIVSNMPLVGAMVDNKCHIDSVRPTHNKYLVALRMNVDHYIACPTYDRHLLTGFVVFGTGVNGVLDEDMVREAARQIEVLRK